MTDAASHIFWFCQFLLLPNLCRLIKLIWLPWSIHMLWSVFLLQQLSSQHQCDERKAFKPSRTKSPPLWWVHVPFSPFDHLQQYTKWSSLDNTSVLLVLIDFGSAGNLMECYCWRTTHPNYQPSLPSLPLNQWRRRHRHRHRKRLHQVAESMNK